MIDVAIVDDHPIVRDGIAAVLGTQDDLHVIQAANSIETLSSTADAIVVDWEMAGIQGADALRALRTRFPSAALVVFSAYGGDDRVRAALDAGARAYVLKGSPAEELIQAIRGAVDGAVIVGRGLSFRASAGAEAPTAREAQVLKLLARGFSNAQIAKQLNISERTVKFHLTSLFARLGARRRTQAVAIARERGLLDR